MNLNNSNSYNALGNRYNLRSFSSRTDGVDHHHRHHGTKKRTNNNRRQQQQTQQQQQHQPRPQHNNSRRGQQQERRKNSNSLSHSNSNAHNIPNVFATINQAQDSMQQLLDRLVEINENAVSVNKIEPITVEALARRRAPPGENHWYSSSTRNNDDDDDDDYYNDEKGNYNHNGNHCQSWKQRAVVYQETGDFFEALVRSVQEGRLNPSRKHGKELTQLVECVLYVCSQQNPYHHHINNHNNNNNNHNDDDNDIAKNENTTIQTDVSAFVGSVLRVLEVDWNLDVSHRHYERAIATCCNLGDLDLASQLFEKQIDPNAGGPPVSLSIENPLALYALAMRCRQEEENASVTAPAEVESQFSPPPSMVAEHVMDAVQRLVMVSPSDQATYVLAAGNALGHACAWNELEDYRRSTVLYQYRDYGKQRTLVAACLRACCLAGEYRAGLGIIKEEGILSLAVGGVTSRDSNSNSNSNTRDNTVNVNANLEEEWQWGGARDLMDPLCRDLAMQVIGGASLTAGNDRGDGREPDEDDFDRYCYDSRLALELFRQSRQEGVTISKEALLGVVEACERDKDWRGALSVLRTLVKEEEIESNNSNSNTKRTTTMAPWVVPGSWLRIVERDQIGASSDKHNSQDGDGDALHESSLPELGTVLASVMRNCNRSSNFGMALFALQLFRIQIHQNNGGDDDDDDDLSPEEGIRRMLFDMNRANPNQNGHADDTHEILTASMVALCGLRCHETAMRLYEMTTNTDREGLASAAGEQSAAASLVYQYASSNHKRSGTTVLGNPWTSAQRHMDQLLTAAKLVRRITHRRQTQTTQTNHHGNHDNDTNNDGILVGNRRQQAEEILARAMNSCTNAHQPELSLYLLEWMEDCVFSQQQQQQQQQLPHRPFSNTKETTTDSLNTTAGLYQDSVTAEIILAQRWTRDLTGAIETFEAILEKHAEDDLHRWRKTISAGLLAMVASGRGNDAVRVFEILDGDAKSTDCYTTIGRHMSKVQDWKELIDLYRDATAEGYSSEELSMLAMLAVTSTKVDNRLRILRAIVDECATNVGLDPKRWTMTKYWSLKRSLGFYHARLLMWWNDEQRAPLDEANLAIKEFYQEKANGMRPKNDVVRAIVSCASRHDSLGLGHTGGYEKVPRSEDDWTALLQEVLRSTGDSPIRYDPTFIDAVVQAYKSLGKSRECVEYISRVVNVDETRLRQSTLVDALEAAQIEHAEGLYSDIQMLLSLGTERNELE